MLIDSGLLNINKPSGITSFGVVWQARRILQARKVGHCGTLDPLAEGILLVLFGKATRLQQQFMSMPKTYRTQLLLGTTTDTGDISGKITSQKEVPHLPSETLNNIFNQFKGEIEQIPPMYSALKYGGKKLYELARTGIEVPRLPRKITIYSIELISCVHPYLDIRVSCSRGTYVRTLAEDIGKKIGCGATVNKLCREAVGHFTIASAIDGTKLTNMTKEELLFATIQLVIPANTLRE